MTVAIVTAPVAWSLGRVVDALTGRTPRVPGLQVAALGFFAVLLLVAARAAHGWVQQGRYAGTLDPLRMARLAVLAKAGSLFGAIVAGGYLGVGLLALPARATPTGRADLLTAGIGVLVAAGVAAAALWLERICSVPPEDPDAAAGGLTRRPKDLPEPGPEGA